MLYRLTDPDGFKAANLATWKENTPFWLQGRMRHLVDLHDYLRNLLAQHLLKGADKRLVDVGCGDAWLLRVLRELSTEVRYTGLDFNESILAELRRLHSADPLVDFQLQDIELGSPGGLLGTADLVACCFSLFEMPRLDAAVTNAAAMLAPSGVLVILSIEPLAQLLAISHTWDELHANLVSYQRMGCHAAYDKDIDVGIADSGRIYRGILYAMSDYIQAANPAGLVVEAADRIVCTASRVPQVYDALILRRGAAR